MDKEPNLYLQSTEQEQLQTSLTKIQTLENACIKIADGSVSLKEEESIALSSWIKISTDYSLKTEGNQKLSAEEKNKRNRILAVQETFRMICDKANINPIKVRLASLETLKPNDIHHYFCPDRKKGDIYYQNFLPKSYFQKKALIRNFCLNAASYLNYLKSFCHQGINPLMINYPCDPRIRKQTLGY